MRNWLNSHWPNLTVGRLPARTRSERQQAVRLSLLRASDVMLASHPRSGNTWLRYLLSDLLLQTQGRKTGTRLPIHPDQLIPDFDRGDDLLNVAFDSANSRCLKTHLPWCDVFRRAIVIFRQPADSLASYYHFQCRYEATRRRAEELGIDRFCLQNVDAWIEHLESFLSACERGACEVHFMTYEELHQRTLDAVARAGRFLGLVFDENALGRAVENHRFHRHAHAEACETSAAERFFRRGRIGSASQELLPQTLDRIHERCDGLYQRAGTRIQARSRAVPPG